MLEKVLYLAEMQIGTVEQPPRSNRTILGRRTGRMVCPGALSLSGGCSVC